MNGGIYMLRAAASVLRRAKCALAVLAIAWLGTTSALAAPDLSVSNLVVGVPVARQEGGWNIQVSFTVTNVGTTTAEPIWVDMAYLSADGVLDNADQPGADGYRILSYRSTALAAGASYTVSSTFATTASTAPGSYTLFAKADGRSAPYDSGTNTDNGRVVEVSESNNVASAAVQLTRPDLSVSNLVVGVPVVRQEGGWNIPVSFTVTNVGTAAAQPNWVDMAYLSADGVLDNADQPGGSGYSILSYRSTALAAGASYTVSSTFATTTSTAPGSYTLFAKADGRSAPYDSGTNTDNGRVVEVGESNNIASAAVQLTRPDLSVSNLVVGVPVVRQEGGWNIPVSFTVTNVGTAAAQPTWADMAYLSTDGVLDNADQPGGSGYMILSSRVTALAVGASYTVSSTFATTASTAPGSYTLFAKADGRSAPYDSGTNTDNGRLMEVSESNNVASAAVQLTRPDLSVSNLVVGVPVVRQEGGWNIPVSFTVTNVGTATAQPNWADMAYLSTDGVLDNADQPGGSGYLILSSRTTALAVGASYTVSSTFATTASTAPGSYTLFAKADGRSAPYDSGTNTDNGRLLEVSESNNIALAPVQLARPDLSVSNLVVGAPIVRQDGGWNIPVSFTVTNVGTAAAQPSWVDMGYLSADGVLDNADYPAASGNSYFSSRGTALAAGESYTVSTTFVSSTSPPPGSYRLFVKADGRSAPHDSGTNTDNGLLAEVSESNNVVGSAPFQLERANLSISPLTLGTIVNRTDGTWAIPVSYTVTNSGGGPAVASWYDIGYLSSDGVLSNNDGSNGYLSQRSSVLAPGESYAVSGATYIVPASTSPGSYTFFVKADGHNASYGGTNFVGGGSLGETSEADNVASVAVQLNIQSDTTTTLATSVNPAIVGQGTTLTATVVPATATGTVTFKDGATVLGTSALNSGVASLAVSFGSPGPHSLVAVYSSDSYFRASTSATLAQTINKSPTVSTLSVSPSTVARDEPVQLTVAVSGADPEGTLSFKDGATTIGTRSLANGSAILGLSFSAVGVHNLTVVYPGDGNNEASTSQVVALEVTEVTGGAGPGPLTWTFGYDANGNQRYSIDPNNLRTDRVFNALNDVATLTRPAPAASVARPVIGFGYDGQGQLTSVTDPRNLTTSYSIDGLGNTLTTASPDTGAAGATYDAAGNILTRTDARGLTSTYAYDSLNRLVSITYASGTPSLFEYDGGATPVPASVGKLTHFTDESGTTNYEHDASGRVVTKTQVTGGRTFTAGYEWASTGNATDKLTAIRYPSGAQVNYLYDATGRVSGMTLNPVNTSGSGTNTGSTLTVLSNLAYTGTNQAKAWTWGDGVGYQRTFDNFGRLISYPLGNPAGAGASAGVVRTLSYDDAARVTGYSHAGAGSLDQSFVYDGLDRLTDAIQGGTFHGYGYDATGNRTQRKIGAQIFSNGVGPTSNRLTSLQDGSGTVTLGYDATGNITSDALGTYTYSARGRMSAATLIDGVVQYRYNALEQRVSKTGPLALVPSGASFYVYDEAGHLIGEYDADGVPRYETVYLEDTPVAVVTQIRSGLPVTVQTNIAFIYTDQIGTPRAIARSGDHAVVWRWDLAEAFGATPATDDPSGIGSFTFNQRFPGQIVDAETGLHYNWHRDYSPQTGRYVQSDPIGLQGGINTFTYVEGSPTSRIDPHGLTSTAACFNNPANAAACAEAGIIVPQGIGGVAKAARLLQIVRTAADAASMITDNERCNERCQNAKNEARKAFSFLVNKRLPDYLTGGSGGSDKTHFKSANQELRRLRAALEAVERHCNPLPAEYPFWKAVADIDLPKLF